MVEGPVPGCAIGESSGSSDQSKGGIRKDTKRHENERRCTKTNSRDAPFAIQPHTFICETQSPFIPIPTNIREWEIRIRKASIILIDYTFVQEGRKEAVEIGWKSAGKSRWNEHVASSARFSMLFHDPLRARLTTRRTLQGFYIRLNNRTGNLHRWNISCTLTARTAIPAAFSPPRVSTHPFPSSRRDANFFSYLSTVCARYLCAPPFSNVIESSLRRNWTY